MEARVLFVDDESKVLESIQNQLFEKMDIWQMDFADGGEHALEMLQNNQYEVIVSDMRMPDMDGAALLKRASETCPGTMRLVLSGYAVPEAAIAAIPYAHLYLTKPCGKESLINTIENALDIYRCSEDPDVRLGISKIMDLPSHLGVYNELMRVTEDENTDAYDIAEVIEKDAAITMKVMVVANSAMFATANPASSTAEAIQRLGGEALKMLVLAVEIAGLIDISASSANDERAQRSQQVAPIVAQLLQDYPRQQMTAAIAAILHDLGGMIFSSFITERYEESVLSKSTTRSESIALEKSTFGVNYAELGSLLLNLWRLPQPVVEAVANQYSDQTEHFADKPISTSLMLAQAILDVDELPDSLEKALSVVPELERDSWRMLAEAVAATAE